MTALHALAGFTTLAATLTLVPGLDTTLVIRSTVIRGRRQGLAATVGVALGLLLWGVTTAVGATALLAASRTAFLVVKVCGVAYMGYVGLSLIVRTMRKDGTSHATHEAQAPSGSAWNAFGQGLWSNILNPKVGVFYLAVLPQFMPAGTSHIAMGAALAGVHAALTLTWFSVLVVLAGRARALLSTPRARRAIDRVAGTLMLGFAGRLAATS